MKQFLILFTFISTVSLNAQDFITEWTFDEASTQIRFNALTAGGEVDYTWSAIPSGNSGSGSFTQTTPGSVILSGLNIVAGDVVILSMTPSNLRRFFINYGPDRERLTNVVQWGGVTWTSMLRAFRGCSNMQISANDIPNLTLVTDMSYMFSDCSVINEPININNWNTALVTNMEYMFSGANEFNQSIGNWNTSSVTNMVFMFAGANAFNQSIGNWNTALVTNMEAMFQDATSFNQYIGNWNTEIVNNMRSMFEAATSFNQNIGNWNTVSVNNMNKMFQSASSFNQDIGDWNTSSVINMNSMFQSASAFNQDLVNWNTSSVTDMGRMFSVASSFKQNIGGWTLNANVFMENMLNVNGMDCDHYSATLVGWATNNPTVTNRVLGANNKLYGTSAVAARETLINDRGWTITGDTASSDPCDLLLSTEDINFVNQIIVYPNPSSQEFKLKFNKTHQQIDVQVFNVKDQKVFNKNFENTDFIELDIQEGSGVYFLKVNADNQLNTYKIIKN